LAETQKTPCREVFAAGRFLSFLYIQSGLNYRAGDYRVVPIKIARITTMPRQKARRSKFKRVLLKLSGEVLQSKKSGLSIDPEVLVGFARQIHVVRQMGVEIAIVVGGGNIFRGHVGESRGIDRNTGDYMGMLATVINALAIQDALEKEGIDTRVQTAIEMRQVAEPFIRRRAMRHLSRDVWLFLAGGREIPISAPTRLPPCGRAKWMPTPC